MNSAHNSGCNFRILQMSCFRTILPFMKREQIQLHHNKNPPMTMVSFISQYRHECVFYGFSVVAILLMWPNMHRKAEYEHDDDGDASLHRIAESDTLKLLVYSSYGMAFPLSVDVFVDMFTKRRLVKQLLARAYICAILVFSSTLHYHYSISLNRPHTAPLIMNMSFTMTSAMICHQLQMRSRGVFAAGHYYAIFIIFSIGSILYSYDQFILLFGLGTALRIISTIYTVYVITKHIYMVTTGDLVQDWYDKWHQTAFEVLMIFSLVTSLIIRLHFMIAEDDSDIYKSGNYVLGISFCNNGNVMLMSTIITNEYRHDYVQLEQKLGVKRMFVRYVSHEVRTPLSSCMLGVDYMKEAIVDPTETCIREIAGVLDEVSEGCKIAIDFMNNLLLYEKIDTMEMPLYLKREDLAKVCAQVLKTFNMSARQVEVSLSLVVHETLQCLRGEGSLASGYIDGPKVEIVLRNLLSNALKFTPKGGEISLSIHPVDLSGTAGSNVATTRLEYRRGSDEISTMRSGDITRSRSGGSGRFQIGDVVDLPPCLAVDATHYRVTLSDTGRGMSKEEQKQLFTKIVQFSPNESQKGGGSGIGLFLSHQIMAAHDLSIQVYSEGIPGRGTKFYMDFPVMPPDEGDGGDPMDELSTAKLDGRKYVGCCPCLPATIYDVETGQDPLPIAETAAEADNNDYVLSAARERLRSVSCTSLEEATEGAFPALKGKCLNELNVLIVDDSAMNRKMLIRTLHLHQVGASVTDVGDGLDLLALLDIPSTPGVDISSVSIGLELPSGDNDVHTAASFDVILLDDNMTYMNGSEAVKRMRQHGYEGLVVGVTGCAREEDMQEFCDAGTNYALPKPFVVKDFIDIVKRHL